MQGGGPHQDTMAGSRDVLGRFSHLLKVRVCQLRLRALEDGPVCKNTCHRHNAGACHTVIALLITKASLLFQAGH